MRGGVHRPISPIAWQRKRYTQAHFESSSDARALSTSGIAGGGPAAVVEFSRATVRSVSE
jgi:hypothetical protein